MSMADQLPADMARLIPSVAGWFIERDADGVVVSGEARGIYWQAIYCFGEAGVLITVRITPETDGEEIELCGASGSDAAAALDKMRRRFIHAHAMLAVGVDPVADVLETDSAAMALGADLARRVLNLEMAPSWWRALADSDTPYAVADALTAAGVPRQRRYEELPTNLCGGHVQRLAVVQDCWEQMSPSERIAVATVLETPSAAAAPRHTSASPTVGPTGGHEPSDADSASSPPSTPPALGRPQRGRRGGRR